MLSVRLPETLEQRLQTLADETQRSRSHYVKIAIQEYLNLHEEHLLALSRLEQKNPKISLNEMEKRLGLDD